jgi:hypothetical protein
MMAVRHFHEFGTTREQLAAIALTECANAARNPKAIFREPLTMDDYLAALICDPLGLYDCDVPIDGGTAVGARLLPQGGGRQIREGGKHIALDGELPINTNGGLCLLKTWSTRINW